MTPQELHKAVWNVRTEIGHIWKTPSPIDCVRYAFTEIGEAMDAWLRQQRPGDARNNSRNNDVLDELGDCAIMLAIALGPDWTCVQRNFKYLVENLTLDDLCCEVAYLLYGPHPTELPRMIDMVLQLHWEYPSFTTAIALLRLDSIRVKYVKTEHVKLEDLFAELNQLPLGALGWLVSMDYLTYFDMPRQGIDIKTGWRNALKLYARRQIELGVL